MLGRRDDAAVPLVAGQHDQVVLLADGFGGDGEIRLACEHVVAHLGRAALAQAHPHVRMALHELANDRRQDVARLSVSGGDGQRAALLGAELLADAAKVVDVAQQALGDLQHFSARISDCGQAPALAHEDIHAEFLFQQADLLRHARLRGMQGCCGLGDVEAAAGDLEDIAQLLEVHKAAYIATGYLILTLKYFSIL